MTLCSFEHKAISPKSVTLTICKICFLDGNNHFSPQFRAMQNLIKFVAPLWTFFSKDPPIFPNSYEKFTKSYLVIICPNSQEKLTSKIIRLSWEPV